MTQWNHTKIGNWINVYGRVRVSSVSSPSGQQLRVSLPYQSASLSEDTGAKVYGAATIENADENMNTMEYNQLLLMKLVCKLEILM